MSTKASPRACADAGFTLVEVLAVVAVIAVLIALLMPGLRAARKAARAVACRGQLAGLLRGVQTYGAENNDCVVPAYNMHGVIGSTANPFDGWGPILHRDGIVRGSGAFRQNPFVCPDTRDMRGVPLYQLGEPEGHAEGYMDWPAVVSLTGDYPRALPRSGFDRIIRVGYWINGDNPNGFPRPFRQGIHFTGSVGYGPNLTGQVMRANRFADFVKPGQLIALADGFYTGNQEATRFNDAHRRIGYRHSHSGRPSANVAFADGHAAMVDGERFPRKHDEGITLDQARRENLGDGPTLYADPLGVLGAAKGAR